MSIPTWPHKTPYPAHCQARRIVAPPMKSMHTTRKDPQSKVNIPLPPLSVSLSVSLYAFFSRLCSRTSSAYRPPRPISSLCVPCSTTPPFSNT